MKGLLLKDFALMKMQKNFFIIILGIAAFITILEKKYFFSHGLSSYCDFTIYSEYYQL